MLPVLYVPAAAMIVAAPAIAGVAMSVTNFALTELMHQMRVSDPPSDELIAAIDNVRSEIGTLASRFILTDTQDNITDMLDGKEFGINDLTIALYQAEQDSVWNWDITQ